MNGHKNYRSAERNQSTKHHEASATKSKKRLYRTCGGTLPFGETRDTPYPHASDSDLRRNGTHAGGLWQGKPGRKNVATARQGPNGTGQNWHRRPVADHRGRAEQTRSAHSTRILQRR